MQEYRRGSTVYIVQESTVGGRSTDIGNSSAGVEDRSSTVYRRVQEEAGVQALATAVQE